MRKLRLHCPGCQCFQLELLFRQLETGRVNPAELLTQFIDTDEYAEAASVLRELSGGAS